MSLHVRSLYFHYILASVFSTNESASFTRNTSCRQPEKQQIQAWDLSED